MHFSQLGVLAALAGTAPAFLLPPSISEADTDIIKTLPFEDAIAMDGRVMEIACPGCPVVSNMEGKMHVTESDSVLKLNFSLAHTTSDQLLLNGIQIYPIDPMSNSFLQPLKASQMVKNEDNTWSLASEPVLGYTVRVHHPNVGGNDDHLRLVSVHLEIVEVADKFLTGIPSIDLKLLETPSGQLMIGDVVGVPSKSASSSPSTEDEQECTTIVCKWRAIIADKLSALKGSMGCGGKNRPSAASSTSVVEAEPERKPHHGHHGSGPRPHHGGRPHHRPHPHHGGHRNKHHSGFARVLRGMVLHIFVPVLIGILCGITASLVGMFVGHVVIFVWRALFRRGEQTRYHRVKGEENVATIEEGTKDEESKGLMEHQGPPPEYEQAVGENEKSEH